MLKIEIERNPTFWDKSKVKTFNVRKMTMGQFEKFSRLSFEALKDNKTLQVKALCILMNCNCRRLLKKELTNDERYSMIMKLLAFGDYEKYITAIHEVLSAPAINEVYFNQLLKQHNLYQHV